MAATADPDSVGDVLADLARTHAHPGIERVARRHTGRRASPTGTDYVAALSHADGDLAITIADDDGEICIARYTEDGFERLSSTGDDVACPTDSAFLASLLANDVDVDVIEHDQVADRFAKAPRIGKVEVNDGYHTGGER